MPTLLINNKPLIDVISFDIHLSQPKTQTFYDPSENRPYHEVIGYTDGKVVIAGYIIDEEFLNDSPESNAIMERTHTICITSSEASYQFRNSFFSKCERHDYGLSQRREITCTIIYDTYLVMGPHEYKIKIPRKCGVSSGPLKKQRHLILYPKRV